MTTDNTFDYGKAKFEKVPCNLCGGRKFFILAKRAANGKRAETCLCKNCGLIYISPRMTKAGYDNYYRYFYRNDRALSKNSKKKDEGAEVETNFEGARVFGINLALKLKRFFVPGLTIDVGSSTGGILFGLREKIPELEILGIEPSEEESSFAESKGVKTIRGLFENLDDKKIKLNNAPSNILCVRSLNHLLDPKSFFTWSYENLKEGGHLILYVKNFRHQSRRAGRIESGVQIDHPYMFTPEVLKLFIESVGFKAVYLETGDRLAKHIMLVGEKPLEKPVFLPKPAKKSYYWRIRRQFFRPYLKIYYWLFYSERLAFLRRLFLHDAFNYHSGV